MPARKVAERLSVVEGDIVRLAVDAIANAANATLLGGGGVDGAIHRGAGPRLIAACRAIGGCPTGEARITPGFDLPARHVIHTVGPIWHGGGNGEDGLLAACYRNSLALAATHGIRTIAFPSISTGAYGFPLAPATRIAFAETLAWIAKHDLPERVTFVAFGANAHAAYRAELALVTAGATP